MSNHEELDRLNILPVCSASPPPLSIFDQPTATSPVPLTFANLQHTQNEAQD